MSDRQLLLTQFGSKCELCGYDRCQRALHFHHRLKREGRSGHVDLAEIGQFPERFQLLCANCHIEVHDALDRAKRVYANCLFCGKRFHVRNATSPSRIGRGLYCSRRCQHAHRGVIAPTVERIQDRVNRNIVIVGDCHEWQGSINAGVPIMNITNPDGTHQPRTVRKVVWGLAHPDIDPPKRIYVSCRNKKCVNPDHFTTKRWSNPR